ncbi:hypothetical protein AS850_11905 [Frondihabitans sp. 762G35]|uniref:hypothetical protein n=1 Tax=Frondihabitans sp. 762G35 TaxID=1446794 RepID=UPI000D216DD2|nr:hypothetical protein [Frondihabitans sp. 762G35]ARC57777.1 hypothetical protein AS850_11905 [Frondihabitans sp. 762G35]
MGDAAYERYRQDARFAAAFRRAYAGRHDPADALFWSGSPDRRGPSGADAPRGARPALLAAAFSREAPAGAAAAAAADLARLDADLARDDRDVAAALALAAAADVAPADDAAAAPAPTPTATATATGAAAPGAAAPRRAPLRRTTVAALGVVVLVVGAALGWVAAGVVPPGDSGAPGGTASAGNSGVSSSTDAGRGLAGVTFVDPPEFSVPQGRFDRPEVPIPAYLDPDTFRQVRNYGTEPLPSGLAVYYARSASGQDCIAVVTPTKAFSAHCVAGRYFPATGLNLYWSEAAGSGSVVWLPDSTVGITYAATLR